MIRGQALQALAGLAAALLTATGALAQQSVKVGLILPLTGPFTPTGRQIEAGARLYMQQHGDMVAGKKIELIVRDDGNVADAT
jgi:branched-chain amino acid transport system substrate-binding protein